MAHMFAVITGLKERLEQIADEMKRNFDFAEQRRLKELEELEKAFLNPQVVKFDNCKFSVVIHTVFQCTEKI